MKPIRKDVRTFLIKNNMVLAIKYITKDSKFDYYDIPGGGIEDDETNQQAAIREFKEESGMEIYNPQYAGNLIVEYPNRIFDVDVFIASEYNGMPQKTQNHIAEWIDINELIQKEKKFTEIYLLDKYYKTDLLNKANFKWYFIADENHNLMNEFSLQK